ncbi:MAG: tRNA 2-selenouridine(34) synthase MnmH [Candidatus Puniceispirillaceae bacterium]
MPAPIETLTSWHDARIDMIIDVRAPSEFADDHIGGAINLPVLSDEERIHIGTLYKQQSPFVARRIGAALVSANIARHIQTHLADKPENWRPLIHCWRGGQRSRAFAHICGEVGWASFLLQGGYKTYRKSVLDSLQDLPKNLEICILSGPTGTGKTKILQALSVHGATIIDLEGLACHRGSLLGQMPDQDQPPQRLFESRLYEAMRQAQRTTDTNPLSKQKIGHNFVFVEAESSRIGNLSLPKDLWHAMSQAPKIEIKADDATRIALLKGDYAHLMDRGNDKLSHLVEGMHTRHGYEVTQSWQRLLNNGDFDQFISAILHDHYDPAYQRASQKHDRKSLGSVTLSGLDQPALDRAVSDILHLLPSP